MPILRLLARSLFMLALLALIEFGAFLCYREFGWNRLYWVPASLAVIAFAGYDTVRRMPIIWGATVSGLLAGTTSVLSWMIAEWVMNGSFHMPPEAEPPLVGTTFLVMSIVGGIVGATAGTFARGRRRKRSRRSALGKLAYTAFDDDETADVEDPANYRAAIALPLAERAASRG
jgi:hypothetical protein